jgi:hypothetical protein
MSHQPRSEPRGDNLISYLLKLIRVPCQKHQRRSRSLLGGIILFASGLVRTLIVSSEPRPIILGLALELLGTIFGAIIIGLAIMVWRSAERNEPLGALIIAFSVVSAITRVSDVVVVGIVLCVIGGILLIVQKH